ncbi:glycosyltransferase [Sinobaca sp. H24]|uniref:glycosyltransferase n=1 Tax=Sinobaca sp. H24 TaxID=2923376 RepID=UPI0020798135|nr:glycosyltransferase [Sinobaca sp. H24]
MNSCAEMSEKMRILIISNMFLRAGIPNFRYIFVKNQAKELSGLGHTADVISNNNPKMGKKELLKKYSAWMLQFVRPYVKKSGSYDVIHAHYAFPSGAIARLMAKRLNIPYVVTCHGGDLNKMANINSFLKTRRKKYWRTLLRSL